MKEKIQNEFAHTRIQQNLRRTKKMALDLKKKGVRKNMLLKKK